MLAVKFWCDLFLSPRKKKNGKLLFSFTIRRIFFLCCSLDIITPSISSPHMWLSMICNKSDHLHTSHKSWYLCSVFLFSIFKEMIQCLVHDTNMTFMWLDHWQLLSYFWIKIYFISHLHIHSGLETSVVNAMKNCKNELSSLIKMILQSELLNREQVPLKY